MSELCAGNMVEVIEEHDAYLYVKPYIPNLVGQIATIVATSDSNLAAIEIDGKRYMVKAQNDSHLYKGYVVEVVKDCGKYLLVKSLQ